jgi:hypothetical protein
MAKLREEAPSFGTVIIYGEPNYRYNQDKKAWEPEKDGDKTPSCEILPIQEIDQQYIKTSRYVLPIADATVCTSEEGLVYSYNCALPYIQEVAHLAEVEKNIIMAQAFLYPGRAALTPPKPNIMLILMVGVMALLALIGMFK